MFPSKTLVLGGGGFLGSYISRMISSDSVIHQSGRSPATSNSGKYFLDITLDNLEDLRKYILKNDFECIINCVANANIEDCEQNPQSADFLNAELPKSLAETTRITGAKFVHFSTDGVFDGVKKFKVESDEARPQTAYGKSKLRGEDLVTAADPKALIARVNFFGLSTHKSSLFNFFYYGLLGNQRLEGYSNIYFTPLHVESTVAAIDQLVYLNQSGIVHVAGSERISKLEFGKKIAKVWEFDEDLITPKEYQSDIYRALDLSLDTTKLSGLGINSPSMEESLVMMRESNLGSLE
jgi:dTDP-4-dehydrorhamnose reductase